MTEIKRKVITEMVERICKVCLKGKMYYKGITTMENEKLYHLHECPVCNNIASLEKKYPYCELPEILVEMMEKGEYGKGEYGK